MLNHSEIQIHTPEDSKDLGGVEPTDYVAVGPQDGRAILMPAGQVLTSDRTPIADAEDGSIPRLDGAHAIKLGGEVLAVADRKQQ